MRFVITIIGYTVGLPLELLVIAALVRGPYRQFPAVFAYSLADFFSTVIELPLAIDYFRNYASTGVHHPFVFWYWLDEVVLQFLVFIVVLSLIWQATSEARSRRPLRLGLILGSLLVAGISFLIQYDPHVLTGLWMTPWASEMSFASAILDLFLWALLIAKRQKDPRVLMLSGGLGIMFAGEATGEALRNMSRSVVLAGGILMVFTHLAFLYVWWQTLRAHRSFPASPLPAPRTDP